MDPKMYLQLNRYKERWNYGYYRKHGMFNPGIVFRIRRIWHDIHRTYTRSFKRTKIELRYIAQKVQCDDKKLAQKTPIILEACFNQMTTFNDGLKSIFWPPTLLTIFHNRTFLLDYWDPTRLRYWDMYICIHFSARPAGYFS